MRFRWLLAAPLALCLTSCTSSHSTSARFNHFVSSVRHQALREGISSTTVHAALDNLQPVQFPEATTPSSVPPLQPESYIRRSVTPERVARAKVLAKQHHQLLSRISHRYRVNPNIILALWGLETDYGKIRGQYPEMSVLATIAVGGHRPHMFRREMLAALRIVDKGDIKLSEMRGSWAGAMGQCQFMPTTYLSYAVDYTHSGRKNIWSNTADIFASTAHFLHHLGWHQGHGILLALKEPKHLSKAQGNKTHSLRTWRRLGLRERNGQRVPASSSRAFLYRIGPGKDQLYLVFRDNFHAVYVWNHSKDYVLSAGLLMNRIAGRA